jgi:hypothetical protein
MWWLSSVDNFTSKEDLSLMLAVWGGFVGLLPPVFLTDEVEVLGPREALSAGCWRSCAGSSRWCWPRLPRRRSSRSGRSVRPAVRDATAALADDNRQRGATPGEAQQLASVALGASAKLRPAA